MAESYPIVSSPDPQGEPVSQPTDMLTTLRVLSRRLKKSLNSVQRLKVQVRADQCLAGEGSETPAPNRETPLPSPTGMCRTFRVSLDYLETEEAYFSRYNVDSLAQLLEIASNILESYCGLLSRMSEEEGPDAVLYPMAGVLRIALDVVICATELCDYQEKATA